MHSDLAYAVRILITEDPFFLSKAHFAVVLFYRLFRKRECNVRRSESELFIHVIFIRVLLFYCGQADLLFRILWIEFVSIMWE